MNDRQKLNRRRSDSEGNFIFRDAEGKFLPLVIRDVPEELTHMAENVRAIFPAEYGRKDSTEDGYDFLALHFSLYGRYPATVSLTDQIHFVYRI